MNLKRTRRKKSEMPFADALDAAQKRLKRAKKEREQSVVAMARLDREIPDLERTIHALNQQLKPAQLVHTSEIAEYPTAVFHHNSQTGENTLPSANVDELPSEEDSFLPEPDGAPILE